VKGVEPKQTAVSQRTAIQEGEVLKKGAQKKARRQEIEITRNAQIQPGKRVSKVSGSIKEQTHMVKND